jgi:uncharacterized protein (DUF885 family)
MVPRAFVLWLALAMGALAAAQTPARSPAGTGALPAVLERYDALRIATDPEFAARRAGTRPRNWGDVSPQARDKAQALRAGLIGDLSALSGLSPADALDRDVLLAILNEDHILHPHDLARIPFTGDSGFYLDPVFAATRTRVTDVASAEAWIARVNAIPDHFAQHIDNMRRGIATGFTAHAEPLRNTIEQVAEQIVDDPAASVLMTPINTLPDTIAQADVIRLRADARDAVRRASDAYRTLQDFLEFEYAPHARKETGISSLPGGAEAYEDLLAVHTTRAGVTAEEVHLTGVREVARIRAEMEAILVEIGWEGSFADFLSFLRNDPQFYARSPEALLSRAEAISQRLRAILPRYFSTLPATPFIVAPVPPAIAPGYTTGRYIQGDAEDGTPGAYWVNTFRLDQRPLYELPALSAHEAVPGHHLQIMLGREMRGGRDFRRDYYPTAYGEGWALYSELLAGEAGIYRTPYERFGALSYQMWRACRLLADTGIHTKNWTREEAEQCFLQNSALAPLNVTTEVTRYIGWPGQATAYMTGQLAILNLRREAEAALGERFDIRDYHDAVLGGGPLPLDLLETRVRDWIAREAG